MVSELNREIAIELQNRLLHHRIESGGTTASICGRPGCGKTTVLLHYAHQVAYLHPLSGAWIKETVIWRGRDIDYWNWFLDPKFEWENPSLQRDIVIHIHDGDAGVRFFDELKNELDLPARAVRYYSAAPELYKNLVEGAINIVYEPRQYRPSEAAMDTIVAKSCGKREWYEDLTLDPCLFWFEFVAFLDLAKAAGFITIILDEADELFPQNPSGIRWWMQEWFRNKLRDFRKKNISFIYAFHSWSDIDYRISDKRMIRGWMRGANPPTKTSMISIARTRSLATGRLILEDDGFGDIQIRKIRPRPRVKILWSQDSDIDYSRWASPASASP